LVPGAHVLPDQASVLAQTHTGRARRPHFFQPSGAPGVYLPWARNSSSNQDWSREMSPFIRHRAGTVCAVVTSVLLAASAAHAATLYASSFEGASLWKV